LHVLPPLLPLNYFCLMETPSPQSNTLFVADIPSNVTEVEFVSIFQLQEGFKGARLRKDKNNHIVGFADFEDNESASLALETLQSYKFAHHLDRGITIHYSHNVTNSQKYRTDGEKNSTKPNKTEKKTSSLRENGARNVQHPSMSVSFMPDLSTVQSNSQLQQPQVSSSMPNYTYPNMFPSLPPDASSTLYVEGLPSDATEREVAHIFRPFPGYQSLRIITKESKQNPSRVYNLCFVEFDNKYQATFALNHLQGYRLDKDDTKGLIMSYAKTERKPRQTKFVESGLNLTGKLTQRNE